MRRAANAPRIIRAISPSNLDILPELKALSLNKCISIRILHSSSDNFPFRYSGNISSANGIPRGPSQNSREITGIEIIQPTPPRTNLPQTICLYQNRESSRTASSRVNCKSASSSGLGPVLIRSYHLRGRSLTKVHTTIAPHRNTLSGMIPEIYRLEDDDISPARQNKTNTA